MLKVIAGAAAVILVVLGARALSGRGHAPAPQNPPPEPVDEIPLGGPDGVPV
jgi:hypothetical protein